MALHTELPIYKTGGDLLALAVRVQEQMPRGVERSLGDKISQHCVEMLDLMALANATKHGERAEHIKQLMTQLRAVTVQPRIIILENVEEFVTWGPPLAEMLVRANYSERQALEAAA